MGDVKTVTFGKITPKLLNFVETIDLSMLLLDCSLWPTTYVQRKQQEATDEVGCRHHCLSPSKQTRGQQDSSASIQRMLLENAIQLVHCELDIMHLDIMQLDIMKRSPSISPSWLTRTKTNKQTLSGINIKVKDYNTCPISESTSAHKSHVSSH